MSSLVKMESSRVTKLARACLVRIETYRAKKLLILDNQYKKWADQPWWKRWSSLPPAAEIEREWINLACGRQEDVANKLIQAASNSEWVYISIDDLNAIY